MADAFELDEADDEAFETFETVDRASDDLAFRPGVVRQLGASDPVESAEQAPLDRAGGEERDVVRANLGVPQGRDDIVELLLEVCGAGGQRHLNRRALGPERLDRVALVVGGDEAVDRLRVAAVDAERERLSRDWEARRDREDALVVVEEDVERARIRALQEKLERKPPVGIEVLGLVDDERAVLPPPRCRPSPRKPLSPP